MGLRRERELLAAVLLLAVEDVRLTGPGKRAQRLRAQATAWIRNDRADHPFSFVRICEELDIHAERIRNAILDGTARAIAEADRAEEFRPGEG